MIADRAISSGRKWAKALAFCQRAFWLRPTGRVPRWGEHCEGRAEKWLGVLEQPTQTLGFRVKLEHLWFEFDLLMEEEALKPNCRRLQARVFELAPGYEVLGFLRDTIVKDTPIMMLLAAILAQANKDEAGAIRIAWMTDDCEAPEVSPRQVDVRAALTLAGVGGALTPNVACRIYFLREGRWFEAMSIPQNLAAPVRGCFLRVESIGFAKLRSLLRASEVQPESIELHWEPDSLLIELNGLHLEGSTPFAIGI